MRRLRAKVEADPSAPEHLLSHYGRGYRFVALAQGAAAVARARWVSWGTRFFGRREELARLRHLLATRRRAVVMGPAGMGKTRLARQLAHERRELGADARIVSLEGTDRLEDVEARVAEALGIRDRVEGGVLAYALAHRGRLVLVLDDATDVLDGLDALIRRWTDAAPALMVVVTARPVRPTPSWVDEFLGGLDDDDAVALLLDRARLAGVEEAAPPAQHLQRLARALGGAPLALELVAPRLRLMGARDLLGILGGADLGTGGVIARALAALPEGSRADLAILARFRSPLSLDVVQQALGEQQLFGRLQRLVDDGFVVRRSHEDEVWLAVLPPVRAALGTPSRETCATHAGVVATWAAAEADDLRLATTWAAAASHPTLAPLALAAAARLTDPQVLDWLSAARDVSSGEVADRLWLATARWSSRAGGPDAHALDRALGSTLPEVRFEAWMLAVRGMPSEHARTALEELLGSWGSDPARRARVQRALATLHERLGGVETALDCLSDSIAASHLAGDPSELVRSRLHRGILQLNRGHVHAAMTDLAAVEAAVGTLEPAVAAQGLAALGFARGVLGQLEDGEASCRRGLALLRQAGEVRMAAYALGNLGNFLLFHGRDDEAAGAYRDAMDRATALGELRLVGLMRHRLAVVQHLAGARHEAIEGYAAAARELEGAGFPVEAGLTRRQLALALAERDGVQLDAARVAYVDAVCEEACLCCPRGADLAPSERNFEARVARRLLGTEACRKAA
jgi:tetratricopeptide (TPR) repeat protein